MSKTVNVQTWLPEASTQKETRLFLTESEVRSFARFKHASPEEVAHIITSLHGLALVAYAAFNQEGSNKALDASEASSDEWGERRDEGEEGLLRLPQSSKAA